MILQIKLVLWSVPHSFVLIRYGKIHRRENVCHEKRILYSQIHESLETGGMAAWGEEAVAGSAGSVRKQKQIRAFIMFSTVERVRHGKLTGLAPLNNFSRLWGWGVSPGASYLALVWVGQVDNGHYYGLWLSCFACVFGLVIHCL